MTSETKDQKKKPEVEFKVCEPITNSWTLIDMVTKRCPPGWEKFFGDPLVRRQLEHIEQQLAREDAEQGGYYPEKRHLLNAFYWIRLDQIEVVFVGQDPYPGYHQNGLVCRAQGVAFSVAPDDTTPKSMVNILKEIEDNYPECKRKGPGDLSRWSLLYGVFLINSCLHLRRHETKDNKTPNFWKGFITLLFRHMAQYRSGIVYAMWGSKAREWESVVDSRSLKLVAGHPSPSNVSGGFLGCKHFLLINEYLRSKKKKEVNWTVY